MNKSDTSILNKSKFCDWDSEPVAYLRSGCRIINYPKNEIQFSNNTLVGFQWIEDRFDDKYQRDHQSRPISQYAQRFLTTYQQGYGDGFKRTPLPKSGVSPTMKPYPGYQPRF